MQAQPALPLLARLLARNESDVVAAATRALAAVAKAGCRERIQVRQSLQHICCACLTNSPRVS